MNRPARRAILEVTPEELADALGVHPGAILDVRHNHQRDVTEVLITAPDLDEVAAMCEPPRVRLSRHPARRLRLAWLSARRRAGRLASVLDDGPPLTLVLDEHRETVRWEQDDPIGHPRHTDDLRAPSVLTGHDAGGRPYFDQTRPWWLCHRTGLVHTEGPCVLRTDPLDLRAGQGPIILTADVRARLEAPA